MLKKYKIIDDIMMRESVFLVVILAISLMSACEFSPEIEPMAESAQYAENNNEFEVLEERSFNFIEKDTLKYPSSRQSLSNSAIEFGNSLLGEFDLRNDRVVFKFSDTDSVGFIFHVSEGEMIASYHSSIQDEEAEQFWRRNSNFKLLKK